MWHGYVMGNVETGDRDDVFSHGFICLKGSTLKQLILGVKEL